MPTYIVLLPATRQKPVQKLKRGGVFDDNFSYFSLEPYVVTPHLNCLVQTVQVRGNNICYYTENYSELSPGTPSYLELCLYRG